MYAYNGNLRRPLLGIYPFLLLCYSNLELSTWHETIDFLLDNHAVYIAEVNVKFTTIKQQLYVQRQLCISVVPHSLTR